MRKGLRSWLLGLVCGSIGCADDGDEEPRDCEDLQFETCDILDESCQAFVYRLTGCVRGADRQDPPPVDVMTISEFEDYLRADLDQRTEEEERLDAQYAALFRTIRFLPEGQGSSDEASIETLARRVAAFYSSDTKAVTIIDRGGSDDPENDVYVLSHEFVHAQQDLDVGLAQFKQEFATTSDGSMRTRSVIEGEAVLYSNLVFARRPGGELTSADFDEYFTPWQQDVLALATDPAEPFDSVTLSFPYPFGGDYVTGRWFDEGHEGVLELYDEPPQSTNAVMAPQGSRTLEAFPPFEPSLPAGYSSEEDRFGALLTYVLLVRNGAAQEQAFETAIGWSGDRVDVITSDAGEGAAMRWTIVFDSESGATAAADALSSVQPVAPGGWSVTRDGNAITLLVADDAARLSELGAMFGDAPRRDPELEADADQPRTLRTRRGRRTSGRIYDLHSHRHNW